VVAPPATVALDGTVADACRNRSPIAVYKLMRRQRSLYHMLTVTRNWAIRHAAPMAHVLAAIYLKGAGLGGDLHVIAANRKSDCSPMLDFIQLERGITIPGRQERLPELADGVYALHRGAVRRQDDRIWRIRPEDCFYIAPVKRTRRLSQTSANLRFDVFVPD
jgi:hypothetical protein